MNAIKIFKDTEDGKYNTVKGYEVSTILEEFQSKFPVSTPLHPSIPIIEGSDISKIYILALGKNPRSEHLLHSYMHYLTMRNPPPPTNVITPYEAHCTSILGPHNPYILKTYTTYLLPNDPPLALSIMKSHIHEASSPSPVILQDLASHPSIPYPEKVSLCNLSIEKLTKTNAPNKDLIECYLTLSSVHLSSPLPSGLSLARSTLTSGSLLETSGSWCALSLKKLSRTSFASNELADLCSQMDVETHPTSVLFKTWARMESENGNYERAFKILEEARNVWEGDGSVLVEEGRVWERMGNGTEAKKRYRESLEVEGSTEAMIRMAKFARGRKKTVRWYEAALREDGEDGTVYNSYGSYLSRLGEFEKAREMFRMGAEKGKTGVESVYHGWGRMELRAGRWEEAKRLFKEGLNTKGKSYKSDFLSHSLGMVLLNEHEISEARKIFYEGLDRNGGVHAQGANSRLLLGAALCEVRLGKDGKARELFERSVEEDKRHAHAWQAWGVLEVKAGNYREARELFEVGIKNCKNHPALWQALARMEANLGNVREARKLYKVGFYNCRKSVSLIVDAAGLEMKEGNFKKGRKLLEKALGLDGKEGRVWCGLIRASMHEGSCDIVEGSVDNIGGFGCADAASIRLLEKGLAAVGEEGEILLRTKDKEGGGAIKAEYAEKIRAKLAAKEGGKDDSPAPTSAAASGDQDEFPDDRPSEAKFGGLRGRVELLKLAGEIYSRAGRWDRARASFERALELDPNCAPLYHSYAQLEAILFNLEGLNRLNKRAEEIFSKASPGKFSFKLGHQGYGTATPLPSQVQRVRQRFGEDVQFTDILLEGSASGTMELLEFPTDE
ncbi:hypothetical protein TrST_g4690 [Triparma strigata]|uniref:TPR-like protein n=1 Tax=Triparma strigata TaxID=1606541 RepID=A0A9W7EB88_9STRA|nr:hypothetical protein TrST_g4690 [Triparma strigata]